MEINVTYSSVPKIAEKDNSLWLLIPLLFVASIGAIIYSKRKIQNYKRERL